MLLKFDAAGEVITDEIVHIDEEVTIGGSTYYRGNLANTCNANIATSASYGINSAAAGAGTDYTILLAGMPSDTSTVAVDLAGYIYATTAIDVYATYLGHAPAQHSPTLSVSIPWQLTDGEAITVGTYTFGQCMIFQFARMKVGNAATAAATLTLSNGSESAALDIDDGLTTFTSPLKVTTEQTLTISTTDGNDAGDIQLHLMGVAA